MFKLYIITNSINESVYVGVTKNELERRFYQHKNNARLNKKTPLYDAIRSIGENNFSITLLSLFDNEVDCYNSEEPAINFYREQGIKVYNVAPGGRGGFVVPKDKLDEWKGKLSLARLGRTPSLGMKHTDENKKLFSEVSKKYWDKHRVYDPNEVTKYSFKEASTKFGISKTHYYRLRRQVLSNEQN